MKLGQVCSIQNGYAFDSKQFSSSSGMPLVRIRDVVKGYTNTYTTEEYEARFVIHNGEFLVGMDGEFNVSRWQGGEALLNQRVCCLRPNQEVNDEYLYYFISQALKKIEAKTSFVTVKHLSAKTLKSIEVPLFTASIQERIANQLSTIDDNLRVCHVMVERFDQLVKSRFVEMFGDPIAGDGRWSKTSIAEFCEVRIGPFGSLLHKEDYIRNGHPLVNPSHMVDGKIITDSELTVSDGKYAELAAYQMEVGDVVLGRRGEIGRCAVVEESGLICGTGSMIVRPGPSCRSDYLQKLISHPSFREALERQAVGVTMKNLNAKTVGRSLVVLPPKEMQDEYAASVAQVDKSQFAVRRAIEQLELLKAKLMQEYFGA